MNFAKTLLIFILLVLVLGIGALWGVKTMTEQKAEEKVATYLEKAEEYTNLTQKLLNATLHAFEQNHDADESPHIIAQFQKYLESEKLPAFLRTSKGAIGVAYPQKSDKAAVKNLAFILGKQGFTTQEWKIISPEGLKTALIVKMEDGTFKYLDPVDGVVAMYENQVLIGPYAARFLVADGYDYRTVFVKVHEESDRSFYKEFAHVMMAIPGNPLYINVAAPVFDEPLVLGEINGSSDDVAAASSEELLTPYMNYIGQKHGEDVHRSIFFTSDAKITFTLTEPADPAMLDANIKPQIEGNKISFRVPVDEGLVLKDQTEHFLPVDQIIIEKL